jgi:S-DNA-T family DNA segregation ATPase FtsK/SpoIIIE
LRLLVESKLNEGDSGELTILDVDPDTFVGDVLDALGFSTSIQAWVGSSRLIRSGSVSRSALVSGCTILPHASQDQLINRVLCDYEIDVSLEGKTHYTESLELNEFTVGRDGSNDVVIDDRAVSSSHLTVRCTNDVLVVTDQGSKNGSYVGSVELPSYESRELLYGDAIEIGNSTIEVRRKVPLSVDIQRDNTGTLLFNRPSRLREPIDTFVARLPDEISDREMQFDLLSSAAPGMTGLAYGSFIPIIGTGVNVAMQKRRQKLSKKQIQVKKKEYLEKLEEIDKAIAQELEIQTGRLLEEFPSPKDLLKLLTEPSHRLWERRLRDRDAFEVRIGLGIKAAAIAFEVRGGRPDVPLPQLHDVPITLDFGKTSLFGIAGPRNLVRDTSRWILAQLSFFRSPKDLLFVVFTSPDDSGDWSWFPKLPHSSQEQLVGPWLIGNDDISIAARVKELTAILDERLERLRDVGAITFSPEILVVFDGVRALRSVPGVVRLLREGQKVGMRFLALDDDRARLPEEINGELIIDGQGRASFSVDGEKTTYDITVDGISSSQMEEVASALAPLQLLAGGEQGEIPPSLRFVDMVDLDLDDPNSISQRWRKGGRTTEAWVGMTATGPLIVDLQRDGPHALVAGTTGAGKSEFLQTLISALAISNRPDALNFVLIDYKGASAFAQCERLPHTVGVVTNLDGHLTERALTSLEAELHRREVVLKEIGAADIDAAWSQYSTKASELGLARLVLVIDEFAELVNELPDFVTGLIRIARVGRSLGIHLVLATQRPTGVVTPEMRANTSLRVALRMADRGDSSEVIDAPSAAYISKLTPGRGYVRTGGSGLLQEFQTARVGGIRPGTAAEHRKPSVYRARWNLFGQSPSLNTKVPGVDAQKIDLGVLSSLISEAAEKEGFAKPRRPWLDPLEDRVSLMKLLDKPVGTLTKKRSRTLTDDVSVPIGLIDLPASQAQSTFSYDLADPGNWGIAGGAHSGKTGTLLVIAASIALQLSPSDVQIYGLDLAGGGLLLLESIPHCGGVFRANDTERFEQFVRKLSQEHKRRQGEFAKLGVANILEQRRRASLGESLPFILVLIDRWELVNQEFSPESGSPVHAELSRLIREASTTGIRFVLTGDRGLLSDRIFSHLSHRLALRLSDLNDYRLIDLQPKSISTEMNPGRAIRAGDGAEIQFATVQSGTSSAAREEVERAIRSWPRERPHGQLRVDLKPERITNVEALILPFSTLGDANAKVALGVEGDELSRIAISVSAHRPGFLVAGARQSGRTTAAAHLAREALQEDMKVVIIAESSQPRYLELLGESVTYIDSPMMQERITAFKDSLAGSNLVIVDDTDQFFRSPMDTALTEVLQMNAALRVVVVGTPEDLANDLRGTAAACKRSMYGLILRPQNSIDGQLFGQRIEKSHLGGPVGRGQLFVGGRQVRVQVIAD